MVKKPAKGTDRSKISDQFRASLASHVYFGIVWVWNAGGGPVGRTDEIVRHTHQTAREQLRMDYASAMSWVLFRVILVATWIQIKEIGQELHYG